MIKKLVLIFFFSFPGASMADWPGGLEEASRFLKDNVSVQWQSIERKAQAHGLSVDVKSLNCLATFSRGDGFIGTCTFNGSDSKNQNYYYILNVIPTPDRRLENQLVGPFVIHPY